MKTALSIILLLCCIQQGVCYKQNLRLTPSSKYIGFPKWKLKCSLIDSSIISEFKVEFFYKYHCCGLIFQTKTICKPQAIWTCPKMHVECENDDPHNLAYSLVIPNPTHDDAVHYYCTVTDRKDHFWAAQIKMDFKPFIVSLKGSLAGPGVTVNTTFQFQCHIKHGSSMDEKICFVRYNDDSKWCFTQKGAECKVLHDKKEDPRYISSCGTGTDKNEGDKDYLLNITSVKQPDDSKWFCHILELWSKEYLMNILTLKVNLIAQDAYVMIGDEFLFSCIIAMKGKVTDNICFHNDAKRSWCFKQNNALCTPQSPDSYCKLTCDLDTDKAVSQTKKYSLKILKVAPADDKRKWWCEMENADKRSNTFILQVRKYVLELTGSMQYASFVDPYTFTCIVRNAAVKMDDIVEFAMDHSVVASVSQQGSLCTVSKKPISDLIEIICGKGTKDLTLDSKTYELVLRKVTVKELKTWVCQLKKFQSKSNELKLKAEEFTVELKWSAPKARYGSPFTFTCTVINAKNLVDSIQFLKNDSVKAVLKQDGNRCLKTPEVVPERYNSSCLTGTDNAKSFTKIYALQISRVTPEDLGAWKCEVKNEHSTSRTFVMEVETEVPEIERFEMSTGDIASIAMCVVVVLGLIVAIVAYRRWKKQKSTEAKLKLKKKHRHDQTDEQEDAASGYNKSGYEKSGYEKSGYEESGLLQSGYEKSVNDYGQSGYGQSGYGQSVYEHGVYEKENITATGATELGYDNETDPKIGNTEDYVNSAYYGNQSVASGSHTKAS